MTEAITITNAGAANSGLYKAEVSNSLGQVTSNEVAVRVLTAPIFDSPPISQSLQLF